MNRTLAAILVGVIVLSLTSCAKDAPVTPADRVAFCKLMLQPPPRDALRNPGDAGARRRFDAWAARAERASPPDIQDDARRYRRASKVYLRSLASGSMDVTAQKQQHDAGKTINDYVDAHCF